MKAYQVIIADDHDIVRSGLELILSHEEDLELIGRASSFEELVDLVSGQEESDILILDLNLGDRNGLEAIREIRALCPNLRILVLSMYPEELYALQAIKAGASGYLNKRAISGELIDAIHAILSGKKYISDSVRDEIPYGTELDEEAAPRITLSQREIEVLALLAVGKSVGEIGEALSISPKTVSTYRARMLEKLQLENTAQLIQYALQNNIVA